MGRLTFILLALLTGNTANAATVETASVTAKTVMVSASTSGRITHIVGDGRINTQVSKGKRVVGVDCSEQRANLQREQASSDSAKSNLAVTQSKYEKDIATRQELDNAIAQHAVSLKAVKAALTQVSKCTTYAPFNGIVIESVKNVGEWAQAGEPIITVANTDKLTATLSALAKNWARYTPGNTVTLISNQTGETVKGTVSNRGNHISVNGAFHVELEFVETEGLVPGMTFKIQPD